MDPYPPRNGERRFQRQGKGEWYFLLIARLYREAAGDIDFGKGIRFYVFLIVAFLVYSVITFK